ncbi:SMI1/KNR4 family protein [Bacillus lacus]|uniref:SMI1/KNR4 family protein n=1 Tax=Metabacillus lacus TaxID=1983721 RepID=A0A7X2J1E5_9BACI|nr:SMI1/KNR4 family protein [Metabacillus lacus]MRX73698.1 SMI1/KNR4 family protein [Metabacillus lacus]
MLPARLDEILREEIYIREDSSLVKASLMKLNVDASSAFKEFYQQYEGPFWEEHVPFELLDIANEKNNIESYTLISRKEHGFPKQYLILSEMSANAVLILDTVTDKIYIVDFEGGDELLLKGDVEEAWSSFFHFLKAYFNC